MAETYRTFTVSAHTHLAPIHYSNLDFILARGEIGWNSQHHRELINETKSHNLKYQFIHLTNEAVYFGGLLLCCTGE